MSAVAVLTGPAGPQHGVPEPAQVLPLTQRWETPGLWVIGAHGGAGESMLAAQSPHWLAAGHSWPMLTGQVQAGHPRLSPCVLTARTHASGLRAAQAALMQWARGLGWYHPPLLGLVLLADAPGALPKPLKDLAKIVSGGAPRVWNVGWIDDWRFCSAADVAAQPPTALKRVVEEIHTLAAQEQPAQLLPTGDHYASH